MLDYKFNIIDIFFLIDVNLLVKNTICYEYDYSKTQFNAYSFIKVKR